ncbi:MAG TPA: methyltransferase domain-containing protein [Pirellulaceae bacterium]|nr:methyltransferase domain-containing protein [Pirellulaceae bacterium]HMO93998.1 methyltransferase domain-containing protein [Pirellulaceae bacterium]HMP70870.1 methyltransferase domain-containing protein [Pirellulaceae bacterium]
MSSEKNSQHYDGVVDSWQVIMGNSFHWGYFSHPETSLDEATDALIDLLASLVDWSPNTRVLDIGCGIGEPATYLHKKFGCHVVGISNSPNGINRAKERTHEAGLNGYLEFHVRDALANDFPDDTFDVAWLMEMSHLIQDKLGLINEAIRSVKPGGQIALCDLMFNRRPQPREVFSRLEDHKLLKRVFGEAQIEPLKTYEDLFNKVGLRDVRSLNISAEVRPTLRYWKENAASLMASSVDEGCRNSAQEFMRSCDVLEDMYASGIWGYGCIAARKPR